MYSKESGKGKFLMGWWVGIDVNCQTKQADENGEVFGWR